jgi:hypothetical protein
MRAGKDPVCLRQAGCVRCLPGSTGPRLVTPRNRELSRMARPRSRRCRLCRRHRDQTEGNEIGFSLPHDGDGSACSAGHRHHFRLPRVPRALRRLTSALAARKYRFPGLRDPAITLSPAERCLRCTLTRHPPTRGGRSGRRDHWPPFLHPVLRMPAAIPFTVMTNALRRAGSSRSRRRRRIPACTRLIGST